MYRIHRGEHFSNKLFMSQLYKFDNSTTTTTENQDNITAKIFITHMDTSVDSFNKNTFIQKYVENIDK